MRDGATTALREAEEECIRLFGDPDPPEAELETLSALCAIARLHQVAADPHPPGTSTRLDTQPPAQPA